MELNSTTFVDVLTPLAAFVERDEDPADLDNCCNQINDIPALSTSLLATLILSPERRDPPWRLDGIDLDGTRFYAVPAFAIKSPPRRIDVHIPHLEEQPRALRDRLKSDAAMYTTDKRQALNLPISQYLLSALEHWSSTTPDFENQYSSLPFGSQIILTDMTPNPTKATFHLVPNYAVEQAMVSLDQLQQTWSSDLIWPEIIDTTLLAFYSQPHEAITLIQISETGTNGLHVFKSLLRDQKYLYNELKMLLSLPPHANLISKPKYIVTHKCRFGGKRGVVGFILEYYPLGSLSSYLTSAPNIPLADKFHWAHQITSVLNHINTSLPYGFYPDLKPDNIVLRQDPVSGQLDAVLLDLEQRGGWFSWSPPEVVYVEYLEILATWAPNNQTQDEHRELLRRYIPDWKSSSQNQRYKNVDGGFSAPWLALVEMRRQGGPLCDVLEKAQVFMLGKMLWCIFEGRAMVRCGIDHEIIRAPDPEFGGVGSFPQFEQTPVAVRELIRDCTRGAPEWDTPARKRGVVLRQGMLVPASWDGHGEMPTAEKTQRVLKEWWQEEIKTATEFVRDLASFVHEDIDEDELTDGLTTFLSRPSLSEVCKRLDWIEKAKLV